MSIIQGTSKAAGGGYTIENSVRLDGVGDMSRTVGSDGDLREWSWSFWVKRSGLGTNGGLGFNIGGTYVDASNRSIVRFYSSGNGTDDFYWAERSGGAWREDQWTDAQYRDPSAWYHILLVWDTDGGTTPRARRYINGVQITDLGSSPAAAANADSGTNKAGTFQLFDQAGFPGREFEGYCAEMHFVDGSALEPTDFGEFNTDGVWIPKQVTGITYGSNGFYLDFADSSDLGNDVSGNGNDFTSSGLTTTDQMLDTPTLVYPTLNSAVIYQSGLLLSDGNLDAFGSSGSNWNLIPATMQIPPTGKWAFECTILSSAGYIMIGFASAEDINNFQGSLKYFSLMQNAGWLYNIETNKKVDGTSTNSGGLAGLTTNDVVECMIDNDAGTMTFLKNGSAYASLSGLNPLTQPAIAVYTNGVYRAKVDFGQIDYVPSDSSYSAINSSTLPTPSITDGSAYFNTVLFTGNSGTAFSVTGVGFQPDFVWGKPRSLADNHRLMDVVRGSTKQILSNATNAEFTQAQGITSFDSDGFTVGTHNGLNTGTNTYVAWCWLADNTTGSSNTDGSINTTATSVNTTAGFSISTYTGNATVGATVGHGLGIAPKVVIVKSRSNAESWVFGHDSVGWTKAMYMQTTGTPYTLDIYWNNTAPTSSVVELHDHPVTNGNSYTYVMYAFAEIPGYSSFGSYTGNGSTDGPFVYTGFSPKYILYKRTSGGTGNWDILDTERDPVNVADAVLAADKTTAETTYSTIKIDMLSNGYKIRGTQTNLNGSGSTYIYMAFAENPFGGDGVAPATAR